MEAGGGRFHATGHKEESPENSNESPPSPMSTTFKATSTSNSSSPKRSSSRRGRGTQKKVVQQLLVPIITNKQVVEGGSSSHHRVKVETINNTPPSDSWAWRKYGQKPIKGSPYPRGYYRCSSSKGCPARKQVERSRTDPTMVIVTYSCEHNHPWPASSRNNHHHYHPPTSSPPAATEPATTSNTDDGGQLEEEEEEEEEGTPLIETQTTTQTSTSTEAAQHDELDQKFTSSLEVGGGSFVDQIQIQYGWFSDHDLDSCTSTTSSCCMLESPLMDLEADSDIFSIREEDEEEEEEEEESFFADLGELPECTTVFRPRSGIRTSTVEDHRRNLTPAALCTAGTTG